MNFKYTISAAVIGLLLACNSLFAQVLLPSPGDVHDRLLLNGVWKFKYFPSSQTGADSQFNNPHFDVGKWADIKTPGNWELQGFAEPVYHKKVKEAIGLYRTNFTIPAGWNGKPVYIAFDGVAFGYTFWVNGRLAGDFASSFNRQTFDISPFVSTGKSNTLAVKVMTHPKGWEFDTNDDWSLSGIFRDVTVFSLSPVHIKDVVIKTFVHAGNASIDIKAGVEKTAKAKFSKNLKLSGQLLDASGKPVKEFTISAHQNQSEPGIAHFTQRLGIEKPKLWSAEKPYLYTLRLSLKDNGTELQKHTERVGIREISWAAGILRLNGSPIKLKGVNHHDLSPLYGRSITMAEMKEDLKLMREGNINFIRLSHYPPRSGFLELCDSMGFYVMDEVPYGFGEEHLKDSSYLPILKLRANATIERDKNHPCIIVWSVGNENPVTDIGLKTGRYVKTLDNTRPYCFPQGPTDFREMLESMPDSVDFLDGHYLDASEIRQLATKIDRPFIAGEYAHALGVDFGKLEEYYEIMYESPKLAGGAVWEFFDQGILRKSSNKMAKGDSTLYAWATKDSIYDTGGNQGTDGVIYANRVPQTDYFQLRKVYTPVKALDDVLPYKPGKQTYQVKLNNRYDFTNLSEVAGKWQLMADTTVLSSGVLTLNCLPHDTVLATINTVLPEKPLANYYYLRLRFVDKNQIRVYEKTYPLQTGESKSILGRIKQNGSKPVLKDNAVVTDNYRFELAKDTSGIQLKNKNGDIIFTGGPLARVGRKPTIAQDATRATKRIKVNRTIWDPFLLSKPDTKVKTYNPKQLVLHCTYKPDAPKDRFLSGDITYNFSDSGYIHVDYRLIPEGNENDQAVESGLSFIIPTSYTEFRWVGKGPYAAYPTKDRLSEFGIYHLNSNDLYFTGNRQHVECAVFTNEKGDGFALIADNANIAVEHTADGIVVSHNAHVSGTFNKYVWPDEMFTYGKDKEIKGNFTIVPFTSATWPSVLKDLFGDSKKTVKAFRPFYHSYDQ